MDVLVHSKEFLVQLIIFVVEIFPEVSGDWSSVSMGKMYVEIGIPVGNRTSI